MHRDLKGANLLVNNRGELKITDFGLARPIEENRLKYTPGVVTRWYRPPELLFGSDVYNESVDIWGAGCIIAEMYIRKPLFGASSDLDQLKMLCMYCGTPTEENYPGVSELPDFSKVQLKPEKRVLKEYLESKKLDRAAIDLIDKMLVMDPKQRITAQQALEHEYFKCEPLPCAPSEIGQFESSHVYTVQQKQEKEQQQLMQNEPKRIRTEYENRNGTRRHHYDDYDSKHSHRHENLRYGDILPPPPPPPVTTVRDRHSSTREDISKGEERQDVRNESRNEHRNEGHEGHGYSQKSHRHEYADSHRHDDYYRHGDYHKQADGFRNGDFRNSEGHSGHHEHRYYNERPRNYEESYEFRRQVKYNETLNPHLNSHRSSHHASSEIVGGGRIVFNSSVSGSESRSRSRSPERRRLPETPNGGSERSRRSISYDDL